MVSPGVADLAFVDELVSISMLDTTIVVRPTRRPDALGTQVLTDVVNAATAAGSTVMLPRPDTLIDPTASTEIRAVNGAGPDHSSTTHPIPVEPIPVEPIPVEPIPVEPIPVEHGGVSLLIVRSECAVWTVDVAMHRFVRGDGPVGRLLLDGSDWTPFEAMWIGPHFVRACTTDGSYVSGRRARRQLGRNGVRNGGRAPLPHPQSLSDIA